MSGGAAVNDLAAVYVAQYVAAELLTRFGGDMPAVYGFLTESVGRDVTRFDLTVPELGLVADVLGVPK